MSAQRFFFTNPRGPELGQAQTAQAPAAPEYRVGLRLTAAQLDRNIEALDQTEWFANMIEKLLHHLQNALGDDNPGAGAVCEFARIGTVHKLETDIGVVSELSRILRQAGNLAMATSDAKGDTDAAQP